MEMNFIEKLSNFCLGNYTFVHLPELAMTALDEDKTSKATQILAGMSGDDNSFEVEQYFRKSLDELNIKLPSKLQSAQILIYYYLRKMLNDQTNYFEIMTCIDNEIYGTADWVEELKIIKREYLGSELGLESMYTWYRELQDFKDGDKLFYYNNLSKEDQKSAFEKHLFEEAENLKNKIENEVILIYQKISTTYL